MKKYHHINETERSEIERYLKEGVSKSEIAERLGRHRSAIYREVQRNGHPIHKYVAESAQAKSVKRRGEAMAPRILRSEATLFYVISKLQIHWTPEQISARMRKDGEPFYVCAETIYQFLYSCHAREDKLYKLLPSKRYARFYRHSRTPQKSRVPEGLSIHSRSKRIDNRSRYGDWEGDLVVGKHKTGNIATLVERKSRFAIAVKNPSKHSDIVINGINKATLHLPEKLRRSVTFDQGTEFANYQQLPSQTFFCDPHAPWQKGANENFNGRLRRFLKKGSSFHNLTQEKLDLILFRMNNTPRKCLNWNTHKEIFDAQLRRCRTSY